MQSYDFIVLTDDAFITSPEDWYDQQAWDEDMLVRKALESKGFKVGRKSWSDPDFDWSSTKAVIFRTTWDYFDRFEEWKSWLDHVASCTRLINHIDLIRWNMDKHYLRDLQRKGTHTPETLYIEVGEQTSLKILHEQTGWEETILKPCVSGAARHTYRLRKDQLQEHEAVFQQLISEEAMMLQPFQHNIIKEGEISLMVMGGTYTHAVIKKAKPGDFRVQDDFGGTYGLYEPTSEEIAFAVKAVNACNPFPAYARVDIIRDNHNQLALIEMELIEPELWFRLQPEAADTLALYLENMIKP